MPAAPSPHREAATIRLRRPVWLCLAVLLATGCSTPDRVTSPEAPTVPSLSTGPGLADTAGRYIVVLRRDRADALQMSEQLASQHAISRRHTYRHALVGFASDLSAASVAALRRHPAVAYVDPDVVVEYAGTDPNAGWAVGRIDQRFGPSDGSFTYAATGAGVNIYIVDSGIKTSLADFGGRATGAWSWKPTEYPANDDCWGHGTQVAAVAAGTEWGVAKGANLRSVRVGDCDGGTPLSDWCAGIDWVTGNHVKPAVLNVSARWTNPFGVSNAIKDAVIAAKAAGVFVVVAAGNDNSNACNYAPANALPVMTVGATTPTDARWGDSNYGACVDLFAPGNLVNTFHHTGAQITVSGTSVAAPMVGGVAAILLEQYPNDTPDQIHYAIRDGATAGVITNAGTNSPNLLLFSTLPVPVYVSISGPAQVGPFMTCSWTADARGGRGPFQYSWYGVLSGTSNPVSGSVSSPGWLSVDVTDALGGHAGNSRWVDVDWSNYGVFCSY